MGGRKIKYIITKEWKFLKYSKIYRIKAIKNFGDVKFGDFGGWIETEKNLDQIGDCWIYDDSYVIGDAKIYDNAKILRGSHVEGYARFSGQSIAESSWIFGTARVSDNATISQSWVYDKAQISGNAIVCGFSDICGHSKIYGDSEIRYCRIDGFYRDDGKHGVIRNKNIKISFLKFLKNKISYGSRK